MTLQGISYLTGLFFLPFFVWGQDDASIGGGYEDNKMETAIEVVEEDNTFHATEDGIWDINDSLMTIPAYDEYCNWNTKKIHAYDFKYTEIEDSVTMILAHEECDFAHPFLGRITSDFGDRASKYHYGIDVKLYKGDPVLAAFEGTCRISQYSRTYGNVIVLRHESGLETLYAHLSGRKLQPGDHIEAGEVLGLGGNTGRSTGSHLHFECRYKGEPINPNDIIDWENGTLKTDTLHLNQNHFSYLKKARSKKYHTIRRGDTLYAISRRYGTSVSKLCRLNGISTRTTIHPGRRLRVR